MKQRGEAFGVQLICAALVFAYMNSVAGPYVCLFGSYLKLRSTSTRIIAIQYYLRNRFVLTVICCIIYHCLEVSRKKWIKSRARSASDLSTYD